MRYSRCTGAYRRRRIACCRTRPPNLLVPLVTLARRNQRTLTEELRRVARTSTTVHVVTLAGTRRRLTRWWTSSATTRSKGATSFSNFWSSSGPTIARSVYLPFFFSFFFLRSISNGTNGWSIISKRNELRILRLVVNLPLLVVQPRKPQGRMLLSLNWDFERRSRFCYR